LVNTSLQKAGASLHDIAPKFGQDLYIHGVIALSQGFLLTSMLLGAILAFMIDHDFLRAAAWSFAAAMLSAIGVIHAYELTAAGVQNKFGWFAAPEFAIAYGLVAAVLIALHFWQARKPSPESTSAPARDGL
jgi:adenine/guanine/hypoxanthine permease